MLSRNFLRLLLVLLLLLLPLLFLLLSLLLRPFFVLRIYFQEVWLSQILIFKGWKASVSRESPGKFAPRILSRKILSLKIARILYHPRRCRCRASGRARPGSPSPPPLVLILVLVPLPILVLLRMLRIVLMLILILILYHTMFYYYNTLLNT